MWWKDLKLYRGRFRDHRMEKPSLWYNGWNRVTIQIII